MSDRPLSLWIVRVYKRNHQDALASVGDVDEETFRWRAPRSNSMAFNLWHIARWADHMQSILSEMTPSLRERIGGPKPEIWADERLSERWKFPKAMGRADTGMEMDEAVAASLPFPAKTDVVEYARRAFDAAARAADSVRDEDLVSPAQVDLSRVPWLKADQLGTVATWFLANIRHESRHLGMIEALKGARGLRGTATV